jgi:hypothetical protein
MIPFGEAEEWHAILPAQKLRAAEVYVGLLVQGNFCKRAKAASENNARYASISEHEMNSWSYMVQELTATTNKATTN